MLRVITGQAKGIKLEAPKKGTRPLTDRIKTSLFDLISDFIPNSKVLDLYAGSGAFGIEALSRGAEEATFVDLGIEAINCIEANLEKTRLADKATIIQKNVNDYIVETKEKFDIIFLDPPFDQDIEPDFSALGKILSNEGILIYRTVQNKKIDINKTTLISVFQKIYGKSKLIIMRKKEYR